MGLLNMFNPILAIKSAKTLFKDLSNYRFYRKQIKRMNEQRLFDIVGGRVDYLRRVYYVINLEPETLLATGDLIDLEKSRVYESVSKIQGRFADHNLVEIVKVSSTRIKDSDYYAYLVTISYDIKSTLKDFIRVVLVGILSYFAIDYSIYVATNLDSVVSLLMNVLTTK